ncbi:hypothetical protein B0T19DRAFT_23134 [Cercophora scortea]|uniref:Uncharacterized protein n=1 Tax=Cercophora scortea TaxID=314031 RepID=A0AAE0J2X0_9PEZI|nr:hypothetical protein B0T19DRAFT_23134 [Cercophora scortea]
MDNKLASFLGDPNFPSKISDDKSDQGERIRFYEDLYRQYSRLAFTRISDRTIAIAGLEKRLIRDLGCNGGFGVFDDKRSLLQRSLLWQRGSEVVSLHRIVSTPESDMCVPSWSWMAYDGSIDFLVPPEGGVEWMAGEIHSPWADHQVGAQRWHTGDGAATVELDVKARGFRMGSLEDNHFKIVYDAPNPSRTEGDIEAMKCVLVGKIGCWQPHGRRHDPLRLGHRSKADGFDNERHDL